MKTRILAAFAALALMGAAGQAAAGCDFKIRVENYRDGKVHVKEIETKKGIRKKTYLGERNKIIKENDSRTWKFKSKDWKHGYVASDLIQVRIHWRSQSINNNFSATKSAWTDPQKCNTTHVVTLQ